MPHQCLAYTSRMEVQSKVSRNSSFDRSINDQVAIKNHLFDQSSINQMDIEILNNYLLLGFGLFKLDFDTHYGR